MGRAIDFIRPRSLHFISAHENPILIAAMEFAKALAFGEQFGRVACRIPLLDFEVALQNLVDVLEDVGSASRDLLRSDSIKVGDFDFRSLGIQEIHEQVQDGYTSADQTPVLIDQ
jgi:hypothetical protein